MDIDAYKPPPRPRKPRDILSISQRAKMEGMARSNNPIMQKAGRAALDESDRLLAEYNAAKAAHANTVSDLTRRFERDVLAEFGLSDHPKAAEIIEYCYNNSEGRHEFYETLEALAPLLT
jgi:hypothetical protein